MHRTTTIAAISVIAVALVGLQFWNKQRTAADTSPLPPLARNLPHDARLADSTFKERVRRRFPVGTPSESAVKELSAEGFRIEAKGNGWHSAALRRSITPCDIVWSVSWRKDAAARIAQINAVYGLTCP